MIKHMKSAWCFGTFFLFFHMGMSSSQLTNVSQFFRGIGSTTNQKCAWTTGDLMIFVVDDHNKTQRNDLMIIEPLKHDMGI